MVLSQAFEVLHSQAKERLHRMQIGWHTGKASHLCIFTSYATNNKAMSYCKITSVMSLITQHSFSPMFGSNPFIDVDHNLLLCVQFEQVIINYIQVITPKQIQMNQKQSKSFKPQIFSIVDASQSQYSAKILYFSDIHT